MIYSTTGDSLFSMFTVLLLPTRNLASLFRSLSFLLSSIPSCLSPPLLLTSFLSLATSIFDDSSLPDDIKAKSHQQHLNRFLHTTRQLPVVQQDLISLEPKVDDLLKLDLPEIKPVDVKKPKKKTTETPRRSKRARRKSQKLDWEEWNQK